MMMGGMGAGGMPGGMPGGMHGGLGNMGNMAGMSMDPMSNMGALSCGMGVGGMNPMMMMQSGVNPMLMAQMQAGGVNPMMQAAMSTGGAATPLQQMTGAAAAQPATAPATAWIDPKVAQLCRHFTIDERVRKKLHDVMQTRGDTFDDDIDKLWEVMESAANENSNQKPLGVLLIKINEMSKGTFMGMERMEQDIKDFVGKYSLDNRVANRLMKCMDERRDTRQADLEALDIRLSSAKHPAGLLVRLVEGLQETGKLPPAPRFLGLDKGNSHASAAERQRAAERERDRDRRGRDRRRSRSRSRKRSRS